MFEKLRISTKELKKCVQKVGNENQWCIVQDYFTSKIRYSHWWANRGSSLFCSAALLDSSTNVSRRIALATAAFGRLYQSVWSQKKIDMRLKFCLYRALVLHMAIYTSKTWTLKTEDYRQLEAFEMRRLHTIRSISLRDRLGSTKIREDIGAH